MKAFKKIAAEIKLHNTTTGIIANFEVTFTADYTCFRCLETFSKEFMVKHHLDYIAGRDPLTKVANVELNPGDVDRVYFDGRQIDLGVGIREAIMFALPITLLCKDDCHGLCPVCGKNLNKKSCNCKIEKTGLFTSQLTNAKNKKKLSMVKIGMLVVHDDGAPSIHDLVIVL